MPFCRTSQKSTSPETHRLLWERHFIQQSWAIFNNQAKHFLLSNTIKLFVDWQSYSLQPHIGTNINSVYLLKVPPKKNAAEESMQRRQVHVRWHRNIGQGRRQRARSTHFVERLVCQRSWVCAGPKPLRKHSRRRRRSVVLHRQVMARNAAGIWRHARPRRWPVQTGRSDAHWRVNRRERTAD